MFLAHFVFQFQLLVHARVVEAAEQFSITDDVIPLTLIADQINSRIQSVFFRQQRRCCIALAGIICGVGDDPDFDVGSRQDVGRQNS